MTDEVKAQLFHVGLTVADVERSIRFYVDVVGFKEARPAEHATEQFDRLTQNPGAKMRTVILSDGAGFLLQLSQYLSGGGKTLEPHHNNIGSPHFAFFVPDIAAKYQEMLARGDVVITTPPVVNATESLHSFYVEDPDGIPVEFLERLKIVDYGR